MIKSNKKRKTAENFNNHDYYQRRISKPSQIEGGALCNNN